MGTLHGVLENGSDLYVNKSQKKQHYHVRSAEERRRRKNVKSGFFTSRSAYVNCRIIAFLYTHLIGNQLQNTTVVFKMHDSVPSVRYSSVCNVLCLWRISLIPNYTVYPLYDA